MCNACVQVVTNALATEKKPELRFNLVFFIRSNIGGQRLLYLDEGKSGSEATAALTARAALKAGILGHLLTSLAARDPAEVDMAQRSFHLLAASLLLPQVRTLHYLCDTPPPALHRVH